MSYDPDIKQSIEEILLRVNEVEGDLKVHEIFSGEPCIPAINELRYAARKLADILKITLNSDKLSSNDKKSVRDSLANVNQYVINAKHDIVDVSISYMEKIMNGMISSYGRSANVEKFPEFPSLEKSISEVRDMGVQSRKKREKRDEIHAKILNTKLPNIRKLFLEYEKLIPDIIYKSSVINRNNKIMFYVGVASLIVGVASLIISLLR